MGRQLTLQEIRDLIEQLTADKYTEFTTDTMRIWYDDQLAELWNLYEEKVLEASDET